MISQSEALAKFKELIGSKESWALLKSSQILEHAALFMAWALRQAQWQAERAEQEYWIGTALNHSSLAAHAEDRDYLPRRPSPSTGTVSIANSGATSVSLPIWQPLISSAQIYYALAEPAIIPAGSTLTGVQVSQVETLTIQTTVSESAPYWEWVLDSAYTSRLTDDYEVYVDEGDGAGFVLWELAQGFRNTYAESKAYDVAYSHTDQIIIRFGNGIFGKQPATGSVIRLSSFLTDGATYLVSGQPLTPVNYSGDSSKIKITTSSEISGGAATEDNEELRRNLLYYPIYAERLVWRDDYVFFLKRQFPAITWINVWGEKEAETQAGGPNLDFINKIFVSAYIPGQSASTTGAALMAALEDVHIYNRFFQFVNPEHQVFTITFDGLVPRRFVLEEVESAIKSAMEAKYGKDSASRSTDIFLKDMYDLVNGLGFFDDQGAKFTITPAGTYTPTMLEGFVSIDLSLSTFTLGYL